MSTNKRKHEKIEIEIYNNVRKSTAVDLVQRGNDLNKHPILSKTDVDRCFIQINAHK